MLDVFFEVLKVKACEVVVEYYFWKMWGCLGYNMIMEDMKCAMFLV